MDTPVSPRGETAQDLGENLGETAQESDAPVKRLQVVDLLHGSASGSDRPSISAADDFNARNAAQNLLSTWLTKSTFLTELDAVDAKSSSVVAATPSVAGQVPPVRITSPPAYSSCSTTQFVGVPAFDVDRLGAVPLRAGYGGLENLVEVEHLSDQDRADLPKLLSEDQDIQRELLVPRDASVEPSPSDFRNLVTGIPAQRELAALLRVYEPQGLARKVFWMSTLLKCMLDRHRVSQVACTLVAEILEQAQRRLSESDCDFRFATEEHSRQEQVLRDENAELQRQLEDYRLVNRQLEDRLRGGTFKVDRVMNFLNRHNARVSGNWLRLKALLEKFKDGSLPPDAWKTQIQINAADEFDADPGVYEYEVESDDEESKTSEVPKPQVTLKISMVDLTGPSSTESTPAKIQRKLFTKQLSVTKAREGLAQPVIWDKLHYAPNLAKDDDVQALRERWDPVVFKELMDTYPWDVMFEDRSKFLILHVRDNLKVIARESLDAIVAFMSVHRRAIWWFGHWVFIDLETDDPYSEELHPERKAECDKAKKEYKKLLDDWS
ncbi:hypothetical protein PHMEG_00030919 [Phytophthora megakarya]|uniref:Uncharacterized protein n=1 Tax=Phytophthora megakarya TaxID=4795 RepID=A0A225UZT6_9STRA|nr:hypothetical protein PHMEG_00030919 [Phytophthora megakarya]